jgi:hypothetical protein
MLKIADLNKIKNEIASDLILVLNGQISLKSKLLEYADGKNLKGDELTAWLGEIFCKILYKGTLVDETYEHDFIALKTGKRYAVKARKGKNKGWNSTSAISKIEGIDCPDYLLFIHFDNKYVVESIWEYKWQEILLEDRFLPKKVRGAGNRWYFMVTPTKDQDRLVYSRTKSI